MTARLTITKLSDEEGYWTARVSLNGITVDVDRKHGSWRAIVRDAPGKHSFHFENLNPSVAAALQKKVRPLERGRRLVQRGATG